jgi:serine/threonine protein kinase
VTTPVDRNKSLESEDISADSRAGAARETRLPKDNTDSRPINESEKTLSAEKLESIKGLSPRETISWEDDLSEISWDNAISSLPSRQSLVLGTQLPKSKGSDPSSRSKVVTTAHRVALEDDAEQPGERSAALLAKSDVDFLLREVIGRGGQGEVWRAWQASLSREVAVKRLISGDIGEFLREAFTTAELDHPNIVPVHELGRTEENGEIHPLLAMKMVRGTPWDEMMFADFNDDKFAPEEYLNKHLAILIDVANAVAYAHSKDIIHRDLKPQQVMVGRFGEVFLMDWGLALSLTSAVPMAAREGIPKHSTLKTATNQCGSPAYMAPEQTSPDSTKLGTHTDVYLLGAILFEIVAGQPPHLANSSQESFFMAAVNECHPIPRTCPSELKELLLASLANDPRDRPASVEDFLQALEEYMSGAGRIRESREVTQAVDQDFRAAANLNIDYSLMRNLQQRIVRALQLWPENPEAIELNQRLLVLHAQRAIKEGDLKLALTLAGELPAESSDQEILVKNISDRQANIRKESRAIKLRIGLLVVLIILLGVLVIRSFITLQESNQMMRDQRDTAEAMMRFNLFNLRRQLEPLGRLDLLEPLVRNALEYYQSLPEEIRDHEHQRTRGVVYQLIGHLMLKQGKLGDAEEAYLQFNQIAQRIITDLSPEFPEYALLLNDYANSESGLSDVYSRTGMLSKAIGHIEKACQINEDLVASDEENFLWRVALGTDLIKLGHLQIITGQRDAGIDSYEQAHEHYLSALRLNENAKNRRRVGLTYTILGREERKIGNHDKAYDYFQRAYDLHETNVKKEPNDQRWVTEIAHISLDMGLVLWSLDEREEAMKYLERCETLYEQLVKSDPLNSFYRQAQAKYYFLLGGLFKKDEQYTQAREYAERAHTLYQELTQSASTDDNWRKEFAHSKILMGQVMYHLGRPDEARDYLVQSRFINESILKQAPLNALSRINLVESYYLEGVILEHTEPQYANRLWVIAMNELIKVPGHQTNESVEELRAKINAKLQQQ